MTPTITWLTCHFCQLKTLQKISLTPKSLRLGVYSFDIKRLIWSCFSLLVFKKKWCIILFGYQFSYHKKIKGLYNWTRCCTISLTNRIWSVNSQQIQKCHRELWLFFYAKKLSDWVSLTARNVELVALVVLVFQPALDYFKGNTYHKRCNYSYE